MRNIVLKHLTSENKKRRDIFIQESVSQDGLLSRTQKRSTYFVKRQVPFGGVDDLDSWIKSQSGKDSADLRHLSISKIHDSKSKSDSLICKVVGNIYAVYSGHVFHIVYVHLLRIDFIAETQKV